MARYRPSYQQSASPQLTKTQETKKRRRKYPNVFFKEELLKVFGAMEDPKTMVASFVTFFCALRQSETCKMKWQDIDLEHMQVKVVEGKGHKDGFIPLSHVCIPILRKWRKMNPDEEYLLPPETNEVPYFHQKALFNRFKKALKDAGLLIETQRNNQGNMQHQYKFHTLRHSRCTHLINNGVPIQQVQHFMRHDKIETTMVYTWITNPELKKMVSEVDAPTRRSQTTQMVAVGQPLKEDPIEVARRRLAYGEIKPKQFSELVKLLQTPYSV